MDQQNYILRYHPFGISVLGITLTIVTIVKMAIGKRDMDSIEFILEFLIIVITLMFIMEVPVNDAFDTGLIELERDVSAGVAPYIVLVCSIIGAILALITILSDQTCRTTYKTTCKTIYYRSLGKRGSATAIINSAGLTVDSENRITKNGKVYGHVYGTYVSIYDQDLTHNPVAFQDIMSIEEKEGIVKMTYKTGASREPLDSASENKGEGAYTISGRGRTILT